MVKKSAIICMFIAVVIFFSGPRCYAEISALLVGNNNFKIFNLDVRGNHVEANFEVYFGNDGEILFSLVSTSFPVGNLTSFWNDEKKTITTPNANLGVEKTYSMKLEYEPLLNTERMTFKLVDWFLNDNSVFGVAFNAMDGFGNWKENLLETSKFSKIAMIQSTGNNPTEIATADSEKVDRAIELGMKPLLVLTNIFFDKNCSLYENYEKLFEKYIKNIKNITSIWGVYVIDEYDWVAIQHGYGPQKMRDMVNSAIKVIKSVLPNVLTIGVAATTVDDLRKKTVLGFPISAGWAAEYGLPNFDLIGFDLYYSQAYSSMDNFFKTWDYYEENIKKFLLPGQREVIIPGTFSMNGETISTEKYLEQITFYKKKSTDPRVGAIICFLWPSVPKEGIVGLCDLPMAVRESWKKF
jgi:hypothetical protein